MKKTTLCAVLVVGLALSGQAVGQGAAGDSADLAKYLIDKAGISRGVCCVVGNGAADLALDIVQASTFLVHALDLDAAAVLAGRNAAQDEGLDLARIVIEEAPRGRLPHAANMVDLVVAVDPSPEVLESLPAREVLRVLRPKGRAVVGVSADGGTSVSRAQLNEWAKRHATAAKERSGVWVVLEKPPLEGIDDWTHWEHGPDNNPVSTDAVIRAPYMTQWAGRPYYIGMPAITTAAGGRTFVAMGHIAHHEREEGWLNIILARNGYNGATLWQRRLPDGYLVHRSAFIATDDAFIMIDPAGAGCLLLDPETGEAQGRIHIPEISGEWKWIALQDGMLFVLVGEQKDPAETTLVRSLYTHWSWGELSKGYYQEPHIPWGFGETILAYDMARDRLAWTHREATPADSRSMAVGGGNVFFYAPDSRIGCLDAKSGGLVWANDNPEVRRLIEEPGRGLGSTPGFRTTCFCVYTPKGLFYEAQTRMNIVAISKEDGAMMWHRRKTTNNPNVIYLDGNILVGIGPEGSTLVVDPATGETLEDLGFKKRSCARLTATPDSLFCRGWPEGLTRYDRATKTVLFNGAYRPSCNDGIIGANGLLYAGPWLCDCNLSLMGTLGLCSAGPADPPEVPADGLEVAATDPATVASLPVCPDDWSAYRGNNAHRGSTQASVSSPLNPLWTSIPDHAFTPTAPTVAGGRVFLGGDDGIVRALDAETGRLEWAFSTAGPLMQPPTIWEGRAYVGSGDGYVYALEAATGRMLWRFRAAPVERRIMLYGTLCSTWPVNTGVLIQDGVAYFAAGIIDYDGTYVYALDARTGALLWKNTSSGHLDPALRKGVSAQGTLAILDGALWMCGGNVISPASYRLEDGQYLGTSPGDGSPQANRGEEIGVFRNQYLLLGGRLRYSADENVVNPGAFALGRAPHDFVGLAAGKSVPAWDDDLVVVTPDRESPPAAYAADALVGLLESKKRPARLPVPRWRATALRDRHTVALALAQDAVVTACRAPQFRNLAPRWVLSLLDRAKGTVLCEHDLPAPARSNGLAIDSDGRVIAVLADGRVACFGGRRVFQSYLVRLVELAQGDADRQRAIGRIQNTLGSVHDYEDRHFLIASLRDLGIDMFDAPREAGAVCMWHLLGPVPWDDDHPMDARLVKEPKVSVEREHSIVGKDMAWERYVTVHPKGMVDLAGRYGPHDSHAAYAYAEVELPKAGEVLLHIGSNDGFKCWFNGDEAARFDGGRVYAPDQDTVKVNAHQGVNKILLKVTQLGGGWGFGVRLTDTQGRPLDIASTTP